MPVIEWDENANLAHAEGHKAGWKEGYEQGVSETEEHYSKEFDLVPDKPEPRKIVQIACGTKAVDQAPGYEIDHDFYALCNDGSTWYIRDAEEGWLNMPPIPQSEIKNG
jgi:hypothetical protein